MKKIGTTKFTMLVLFFVMLGLVYYTHINNHAKKEVEEKPKTEKEQLLNYDFDKQYPKTPRETVKLHLKYLKAIYNNVFEEDELFQANNQMRQLFDEELLEHNTADAQLQGLKNEILLYQENKQKFVSYSLPEASQIQYNQEDGVEFAKMKVTIVMKVNAKTISADEEYLLRKDEEERWKILGWQVVKKNVPNGEGDEK